ncbi:MAG: hypothetical protein [Microviridae sp.]|nr:MAG: hypothetical protein [Microviridae sp.]
MAAPRRHRRTVERADSDDADNGRTGLRPVRPKGDHRTSHGRTCGTESHSCLQSRKRKARPRTTPPSPRRSAADRAERRQPPGGEAPNEGDAWLKPIRTIEAHPRQLDLRADVKPRRGPITTPDKIPRTLDASGFNPL